MEIDKKKKGKLFPERNPLSDCTNFITPAPINHANPTFASCSKSQFESPSVRSDPNGGDEIQSVGNPDPPRKEPSSSTLASSGADSWLCVSGTDQSQRLYKRRRLDAKKSPSIGSLSCPPVVTRRRKSGNNYNEIPSMPGPARVRNSASSSVKQKETRMEGTSSSEHGSRMSRSVSTSRKPKRHRHSISEITVHSSLPKDYVKEQTAHFAEIDAFELQVEEASSDEQD